MEKYQIKFESTLLNSQKHWAGSILKLSNPTIGKQNTVSFSEGVTRTDKNVAISELIHDSSKLDFVNNEVIFIPTSQRLLSLNELIEKLRSV